MASETQCKGSTRPICQESGDGSEKDESSGWLSVVASCALLFPIHQYSYTVDGWHPALKTRAHHLLTWVFSSKTSGTDRTRVQWRNFGLKSEGDQARGVLIKWGSVPILKSGGPAPPANLKLRLCPGSPEKGC